MNDKSSRTFELKAGHKGDRDRVESIGLMEPMLLSDDAKNRRMLGDLAVELAVKAAEFRRSLPAGLRIALVDLMRLMNCYYSNLIEGHDIHPVDIERALNNDYSGDPKKRDLQVEAKAHIAAQRWVDQGGLTGRATTRTGLIELHRRFCEELPPSMMIAEDPATKEKIRFLPGEIRLRDVEVGRHVPVSPDAVPRFLERFERAYSKLDKSQAVLSVAAAHHRFLWIHPFLDGNGRVARLMSHAMLLDCLETGGVWSIARGLALRQSEYKAHLQACDLPRRNDLDGRGNLSEEELGKFSKFFLETSLDQIEFMAKLMQPDGLRARLTLWAEEETKVGKLPQKATQLLEALIYQSELGRGEVNVLLGVTDSQAQLITGALQETGILLSNSSRAPWRLAFPAASASWLMPGLFPERY